MVRVPATDKQIADAMGLLLDARCQLLLVVSEVWRHPSHAEGKAPDLLAVTLMLPVGNA